MNHSQKRHFEPNLVLAELFLASGVQQHGMMQTEMSFDQKMDELSQINVEYITKMSSLRTRLEQ